MPTILDSLSGDERRVLYACFSLSVPMRLAIMARTGLSNGRVTEALRTLRAKGMIVSTEEIPQGQGRPSAIHRISSGTFYGVGAALEVGSCTIVAISGSGELLEIRRLATKSLPMDTHDVRGLLAMIKDEITSLVARRGDEHFIAAGLSVIGRVDTASGMWLSGLLYGPFRNIDVASAFEPLGVPVVVEDHARSLAFIELRRSPDRRDGSFVLLYMGEGLGSALVLDGRIYRGYHGVAGEIGHMRLEGNDRRCFCGDTGCLETVSSSSAVIASVKARIAEGVSSILATQTDPSGTLTLEAIGAAAGARDRLARQVLEETGAGLGEACVIMMKIMNVPRIVVAGKGTVLAERLQEPLHRRIRECAPQENQLDAPVRFIPYAEEDESRGVALLAMDKALSDDGASARDARRM